MTPWRRRGSRGIRSKTSVAHAVIAAIAGAPDPVRERVLRRHVRLTVDSGGAASLPHGTTTGRTAVAARLRELLGGFAAPTLTVNEVNGGPGILVRSGGAVVGVLALAARGRAVGEVWAVVNPVKLGAWNLR